MSTHTSSDQDAEQIAETIAWIPSAEDQRQKSFGSALVKLQKWLIAMRRESALIERDDGVMYLNPEVSARFGIAVLPTKGILVMPELECDWAAAMPWSRAAMFEDDPTLYLVMDAFDIDGMEGSDFAISFRIPDLGKASHLSRKETLEIRRFGWIQNQWAIEPKALSQMPIEIVNESRGVFDKRKRKLKFKGKGKS